MKLVVKILCVVSIATLAGCASQNDQSGGRDSSGASHPSNLTSLDPILAAAHRSPENRARDRYRHPRETLEFFGLRPDMTVVEVWPGNGWYTEILAPLLRERGKLYVAQIDPTGSDYAKRTVDDFRAKLAAQPSLYDRVIVTTLAPDRSPSAAMDRSPSAAGAGAQERPSSGAQERPPAQQEIAPPASADLVLTFRNLHNWMMFGWQREALQSMHAALKPGGVLGIVEHRGNAALPQDPRAASGYVNEAYAIELIESVGFKLVERSAVNANPLDTKDYERGVWTLPPSYAGGAADRARFEKIGESDRFTLKFVKVGSP